VRVSARSARTAADGGGLSAVHVTRHTELAEAGLREQLWGLYEDAYGPVTAESPSHEMLFRDEFDEAIDDPANRLWVLWDDDSPVAMTLIATDIGPTRYLSRRYFDRRFPEHSRRRAVHYIMWLVVHPMYAAQGAIVRLARDVLQREAADGALLVFDAPLVHQAGPEGGFAEMMARLCKAFVGPTPLTLLGASHYYAVDFAAEAADAAPASAAQRTPA